MNEYCGIILAATVLLVAVIKLGQRWTRRTTAPSTLRLLGYGALLVLGALLVGGAGLIAAAVVIMLLEVLRNVRGSRAASSQ